LDGEEEGDGDDGDGSGQDGPGDGAAPHHLVHLRRQELWQLDGDRDARLQCGEPTRTVSSLKRRHHHASL